MRHCGGKLIKKLCIYIMYPHLLHLDLSSLSHPITRFFFGVVKGVIISQCNPPIRHSHIMSLDKVSSASPASTIYLAPLKVRD